MIAAARARPHATFVVPVYNGESFVGETLKEVHEWLAHRPESWELIVVDDASTDATPRIVEDFVRERPHEAISHIRFTSNQGKGFAVRTGVGLARGEYTIFTDSDLAYDVANTDRLLAELRAGAGAAIACRVLRESTYRMSPSFFSYLFTRHIMGRAFNLLCRLITVPRILDTQAGMKGFRTAEVRPVLPLMVKDGFSFDVELLRALLDRGTRVVEVPVDFRYDSEPTTVRFLMDSLRMMRDLVDVRYRSLRGTYRAPWRDRGGPGLVIHADDFGLSPGINDAIESGLSKGVLSSTSIVMGTPHSGEAAAWAGSHPEFDFGAHLNLTQGRPILPADRVPSLVDSSGAFLPLGGFIRRYLTGRIRAREIMEEWTAQIEAIRSAGVALSHMDSHQHVHLLPHIFTRVTVPLARRESLRVRAMDGPVRAEGWLPGAKGVMLAIATRACVRGRKRRLIGAHGTGTQLRGREMVSAWRSLIGRLRPGRDYELVVHPGIVDEALIVSGDGFTDGRQRELSVLSSEEFRSVVRQSGVELKDFRGIGAASSAEAAG